MILQGRIQDFKLGRAHLKILRRAEGGAKICEVFCVKNHNFTPKNHIFSNIWGGGGGGRQVRPPPPPGSAPELLIQRRLFVVKQNIKTMSLTCPILQKKENNKTN